MFKPGTWVGAGRWPNQSAHPDLWPKPLRGQVIDFCDVRAWANSIQFPEDVPHAGDVMTVALRMKAQGALNGLIPVCWDYVTHRRVLWEKTAALRSYEDDMLLWKAARAMRADEIQHPRRRKPRDIREFLPQQQKHLALA
ncbi:hypothetical protein [Noviherbaspirillum saxi]|uniref:Uncharacterized protein n=1 Tax=Noviherbaspirillum saxi TaxID=2320863 RepID=A0A3A3FP03_9BURK|nr:hypothetical protein [Noviherbaspirillum saxi]RJF96225.1 hypothetical protein D3871_23190 [Noviherbaspirillum saxi]